MKKLSEFFFKMNWTNKYHTVPLRQERTQYACHYNVRPNLSLASGAVCVDRRIDTAPVFRISGPPDRLPKLDDLIGGVHTLKLNKEPYLAV